MDSSCNRIRCYRFSIRPSFDVLELTRSVYTEPFDYDYDSDHYDNRDEIAVEKAYFTKETIEALKKELIKRIEDSENPFYIGCVDYDEYDDVTDEELLSVNLIKPYLDEETVQ